MLQASDEDISKWLCEEKQRKELIRFDESVEEAEFDRYRWVSAGDLATQNRLGSAFSFSFAVH
jgi:hypothetical protein